MLPNSIITLLHIIIMPLNSIIMLLHIIIMPLNSIIMPHNIIIMLLNMKFMPLVRHMTGNDEDYLRKIPRVVVQKSALLKGPL